MPKVDCVCNCERGGGVLEVNSLCVLEGKE